MLATKEWKKWRLDFAAVVFLDIHSYFDFYRCRPSNDIFAIYPWKTEAFFCVVRLDLLHSSFLYSNENSLQTSKCV